MPSLQSHVFRLLLKYSQKKQEWDLNTSITKFREECEAGASRFGKMPEGIEVLPLNIDGIYAEWILPSNAKRDRAILYTIGGGYVSGSCKDHRLIVSKIVKDSGVPMLLFDHRLAPEHPYPAALEDSITAYRWLLDQGITPSNIMIVGESAGGGLCLATLLALRDQGMPLPAAAVAISPWTDLKLTGESHQTKANVCLSPKGMSEVCSKYYVGDNDPCLPWISPLYGDLQGLPPILIYVGEYETLLDDSVRFAEKAKSAGVDITLNIGKGMIHCYPLLPPFIPEAREAMADICSFIRKYIG